MAIRYAIEDGVLILRATNEGYSYLRAALYAIARDPAALPKMPLLLDLRGEPPHTRYEDLHWRAAILTEMQAMLGPRWAFLTDPGPVRPGIGRMFAVFSEAEGLSVDLFADKQDALRWLREGRQGAAPALPGGKRRD